MYARNDLYRPTGYFPPKKRKRKLKKKKALKALLFLVLITLILTIGTKSIMQALNNTDNVSDKLPKTSVTAIGPGMGRLDPEADTKQFLSGPPVIYDTNNIDFDYLLDTFSFLDNPIPGSHLSWNDAHLPNSPRPYRNGYHQGLDFYPEGSGAFITTGTPIYTSAPGTIIRIDHNYQSMTIEEHSQLSKLCQESPPPTPEKILDKFRGRQVWVDHGRGIITRYAHLEDVNNNLNLGDYIERETQLGTIGATGTNRPDRPHLHLEVWAENNYLGEGMNMEDVRKLMQALFFE